MIREPINPNEATRALVNALALHQLRRYDDAVVQIKICIQQLRCTNILRNKYLERIRDFERRTTMESIDRSEVSRSLAKAIAFKQCGKDKEAEAWAILLIKQLKCANILKSN